MDIKDKYNLLYNKQQSLIIQEKQLKSKVKKLSSKIKDYKNTRTILNESIKIVHQKFKEKIEHVITNAIRTIFDRDLTCNLIYEEKYNEIVTHIIIKEDNNELDPKDEMGGSIVNVISFVFRIILWHFSSPRPRNVFILDEPFTWTGKLISFIGMILKDFSRRFNFQVILITHDNNLIEFGDRVFKVSMKNKRSIVRRIRIRNLENTII